MSRNDQPTDAEMRALRAYVAHGSARAAAAQLHCSEQTVKNHLQSIRSKLGVHRIAQAALILHDRLFA